MRTRLLLTANVHFSCKQIWESWQSESARHWKETKILLLKYALFACLSSSSNKHFVYIWWVLKRLFWHEKQGPLAHWSCLSQCVTDPSNLTGALDGSLRRLISLLFPSASGVPQHWHLFVVDCFLLFAFCQFHFSNGCCNENFSSCSFPSFQTFTLVHPSWGGH